MFATDVRYRLIWEDRIMKRQKTEDRRKQFTLLSALFLMTAVIIGCVVFHPAKAQAAPAETSYKYYTSIQVQKGDTLWSIASTYMTDGYESVGDYIEEICQVNRISDSDIHSGQYLTLPYYSDEYLE